MELTIDIRDTPDIDLDLLFQIINGITTLTKGAVMTISEHRISTVADLTSKLASHIETELIMAAKTRGRASLVVSGGSTPRPLLEELAQRLLPWAQIYITLADERWVDPSSKDSNEAMVRQTLLQGDAAAANFVPLKNSASDVLGGQKACNGAIENMPRPFDLVVLGMGEDGHTASLFPGVAGRALDPESEEYCMPVYPQHAPHARMSLTARAILDSRRIVLHISGERKWQVYQQALTAGPAEQLPIRVILHQDRVPVDVYWSS